MHANPDTAIELLEPLMTDTGRIAETTFTLPLAGVRVVELSAVPRGPAPFGVMTLADMGASVVTVVPPGRKPRAGALDPLWRGRAHVELDLKSEGGRAGLLSILAHADVLVEGFRPGAMERLGLGPDEVLGGNPRLVYSRVTGWGQQGPLAQSAGHRPIYLAMSGALDALGHQDLLADLSGGGWSLALGVLGALRQVGLTGAGQVLDVAIIDSVSNLMTTLFADATRTRLSDERYSPAEDGCPYNTVYEASDRRFVAVCPIEQKFYDQFITALGLDADTVPDRKDRANWPALRQLFARTIATRTRDDWAATFAGADGCLAPVLSLSEASISAHALARGSFVQAGDALLPVSAPRFSNAPAAIAPIQPAIAGDRLMAWGLDATIVSQLTPAE